MVDSPQVQDGRVQVMHMHGVFHHMVVQFVGRAVGDAGLPAERSQSWDRLAEPISPERAYGFILPACSSSQRMPAAMLPYTSPFQPCPPS